MIIALASQFHVYLPWGQLCLNSVLNVKALVGAFNQEMALAMGLRIQFVVSFHFKGGAIKEPFASFKTFICAISFLVSWDIL